MPFYTKSEAATINAAWNRTMNFLERLTITNASELEAMAVAERRSSYSATLGHWSPAECRLYVLRQVRDGIRNGNAPIKPEDYTGHRPSLLTAFFVGCNLAVRYGQKHSETLAGICGDIDTAAVKHGAALERLTNRATA